MNASARSYLLTGVAAVGASAIAIASSVAPSPDVGVPAHQPATAHVVSKATVELLAAVQRITPGGGYLPAGDGRLAVPQAAAVAGPVTQNAASDAIVNAWTAALPWIDYGVDLTDYVLGFVPGLYLIGDQVSIVYYSLVRPVANSFVVDLVAPVVNDPLNINSYVNGLTTLGSVTVNSLINLGINEFNYFFGWLVPPLPPLPLTAQTATNTKASADLPAPAAHAVDTVKVVADTLPAGASDVAGVPASIKSALKAAATPTRSAPPQVDVTEQSAPETTSAEVANDAEDQQSDGTQEARASASSPRVRAQGERRLGTVTGKKATERSSASTAEKPANADEAKRTARASTRKG